MTPLLHPADLAGLYEEHQAWPSEVTSAIARTFKAALHGPPRKCLFLGTATGVNDALPFARAADPEDRIIAGDIEPALLERLRTRVQAEGLGNLEPRLLDVTADLSELGVFDLVTLLFVVHRLKTWETAVDRVIRLVAPGGSIFISEFAGPSGLIYLSNENGGRARDPISRLIRRYFELLPDRFEPPLKSTWIGPVLERLGRALSPRGHQDFAWKQVLTPRDMLRKIEHRAYAPYFSTHPTPEVFRQLQGELGAGSDQPVALEETIRVHRFVRPGP